MSSNDTGSDMLDAEHLDTVPLPVSLPSTDLSIVDTAQMPSQIGSTPGVAQQLVPKPTIKVKLRLRTLVMAGRHPVIIPRFWYRKVRPLSSHSKNKHVMVHLAIVSGLFIILMGTLMAVMPLSGEGRPGFQLFQPIVSMFSLKDENRSLIAQQLATATAVTQDGFDPGGDFGQYAGVPSAPVLGAGGLNRFFYGQCTYWANMHYHDLTGHWVPWLGNAAQWLNGAVENGWVVSGTPHVPSIIVLQPWVQGAGYYGHVAIVEKINNDGSVVTSNWNWAGNWAHTTDVTFYAGPGVTFVWYQGD